MHRTTIIHLGVAICLLEQLKPEMVPHAAEARNYLEN